MPRRAAYVLVTTDPHLMFSTLSPMKPGTEPLLDAVRACRAHLIGAALFSALINILYLTPTLFMMQVYDRVVPTGGVTTLMLICTATVLALATLAGLDWLRTRLLLRSGLELDTRLAGPILSRVVDATARPAGGQALREFDQVRSALSGQGVLALFDAPWTPLYLGCCFLLHPAIGMLTLAGGLGLVLLAWANEREGRNKLEAATRSASGAYALQENLAEHAEVVRALGMRTSSIRLQLERRRSAVSQQVDNQFVSGRYSGAIKFFRLCLQSAALALAAFLVVRGQISGGSIVASSILLSRAVSPVEQLVQAWPTLVQATTAWRGLLDLFASTAIHDRTRTRLPAPEGRLRVEGVGVKLPDRDAPVLRNITLALEPGKILGVIGASGSGKTTLIRVIAGGLKPSVGAIRLDGSDYDARESDELAKHIGYLPQSPTLFAGTISDNISRFAASAAPDRTTIDENAVAAAVAAGVHGMIQRLPQGYDTVLGPHGAGLSAGQAQRVAFARALYGNPVLLVLDEPNASLDQDGEAALMKGVASAAARGTAVVIVTHKAGLLAKIDRLVVLNEGVIQTDGPREDVLAKIRPMTRPAGIRNVLGAEIR